MKGAFALVFTSILFLTCTGPSVAQEIELIPELKDWEPLLGKWNHELELRESPTGDWKKESVSVEISSGGFFVELRGTGEREGQESSGIELVGYDPIRKTFVASGFVSDGSRMVATSGGWYGTTLTVNYTNFTREREVLVGRNTWEFLSDFKSGTGTWEQFTDGKWWIFGKVKTTKIE